eukprot:TRINITY_DN3082_c0_g2_i5.p1 TRINITY_DN3082_c0_g2~~TRINITY_DN3082_c0_g2_i5.p1  ORF type:complete len:350 (-),score=24.97 TRINITY_DN3082_c0_g2_i5:134-1183(-)
MAGPTSRAELLQAKRGVGIMIMGFIVLSFFVFDSRRLDLNTKVIGFFSLQSLYEWFLSSKLGQLCSSPTWFHLFRMVWAVFLMVVFVLIEYEFLPGRKYKIRQDLRPPPREVYYYFQHSIIGMFVYHLIPLAIFEHFYWPQGIPPSPVAPGLFWLLVSVPLLMLVFDTFTFLFHLLGHYILNGFKGTFLNVFLTKEHHVHHDTADSYTYSWTGYFGSWLEALGAVFFFTLPLHVLGFDPLTKLWSCFWFHVATTNLHSGYDFPFFFHNWFPFKIYHGSVGHYFHHKRCHKNLSTFFSFYDHLFNTYFAPNIEGEKEDSKREYFFLRDSEDMFPELSFILGKPFIHIRKD